eukprot:SM001822S03854  [mRNA]  locus=s1822:1447:1918:- [translate_table: standard]
MPTATAPLTPPSSPTSGTRSRCSMPFPTATACGRCSSSCQHRRKQAAPLPALAVCVCPLKRLPQMLSQERRPWLQKSATDSLLHKMPAKLLSSQWHRRGWRGASTKQGAAAAEPGAPWLR